MINAIGELRDLGLHFYGQTFSSYAIAVKNCARSGAPLQICLDLHGLAVELLLLVFYLTHPSLAVHYHFQIRLRLYAVSTGLLPLLE